ncbi:DNA dependent protein kinase catalytic subunit [Reticulomyxa filosa]|uniref:DNA dependent protein kinase catalytic subunit n=1 Tax=Reticulomyxa filosa TaxID=46433 RepID=X6M794_RETFI|nr:DNA dependent protein kinase catalytic subunit [Reticulomyxa filosa]|eukprot:ETO08865.1 DNA dependent protein kinase catalytic subunit [Reticulomyxa filosa]
MLERQMRQDTSIDFTLVDVIRNQYIPNLCKSTRINNHDNNFINSTTTTKKKKKKLQRIPIIFVCKMYTYGFGNVGKGIVEGFHECEKRLHMNLLQKCILQLARNNESYIQLRDVFARTLAVYTTCGYILGIGDRHLDNYLVDQTTGQIIGIDFGAAFGYGLGLGVPEMMPLRYTRQFQHLMDPLDSPFLFKTDVTHTLRALQKNKENLLNVMNVFIKEPSLDWVEMAQRNFKDSNAEFLMRTNASTDDGDEENSGSANNPDIAWYPKHKVEIAKMKLNGYKSSYVMVEEIQSTTHYKAHHYQVMKRIINGELSNVHSKRLKYPDQCETVEDQVECLIDHAMDDSILSITWQGWSSWV